MEADDWVPEWEMENWEDTIVYYDEFGDEVSSDY